jgi:ABC-type lipoprotein release transport system permease subunit
LVRRNVAHYWRTNVAVALGCAVAVAALVGSLLVGDSVRGSLRDVALERLGRVEYALTSPSFFREQLAADLLARPEAKAAFDFAVPAILLNGTAKPAAGGAVVPSVSVIGVTPDFWGAQGSSSGQLPEQRRVLVNSTLARDLGAAAGDAILLTVGQEANAPVDSIFARRSSAETTRVLRLIVAGIIPSRGVGIFSLRQDQPQPRNLYISLAWLQAQLQQAGRANTILAGCTSAHDSRGPEAKAPDAALAASLRLEDYGLRLAPNPAYGYVALESGRLLLSAAEAACAERAALATGMRQRLRSVYLANTLAIDGSGGERRETPYSVVAGLAAGAGDGWPALSMADGSAPPALGGSDILLNAWVAEDLGARVGDQIEMTYYAGDERGNLRTEKRAFMLRGIVAMEGLALDKGLVPGFRGITDSPAMADWDPPFPVDLSRIRPKDEQYWKEYRTTPKAFLALDTVRDLWTPSASDSPQGAAGPPEGGVTSVALRPADATSLDAAAERFEKAFLQRSPADFLPVLQPVRSQALAAAQGTTDFGVLFVSMSLFLVAAAAGMVGLLLRLSVERRAGDFGIMTATGFAAKGAGRVLIAEGLLLGGIGALLGSAMGVGYARLIVLALRTWWSGAVGDFSLTLHVSAATVAAGAVAGFLVSAVAVGWAARLLRHAPTLTLLAGWRALATRPREGIRRRALVIGFACLAPAGLLVLLGGTKVLSAEGAFFGGGALLLVGLLSLACAGFQRRAGAAETVSLWQLGWRGASRNWLRSLLTAGLLACASFIVVAVAANRKDLSRLNTAERGSGAGGFALLARSNISVLSDLNSAKGLDALGVPPKLAGEIGKAEFFPFRMSAGDDASCLSIQRPAQPRLLGVPHELVERGGFTFTSLSEKAENPWLLLEREAPGGASGAVPAFADATSAQWVLHVGLGDEVSVVAAAGRPVRLKIVGLLADSVFASELLISDAQFRQHFGADTGYRFFLIETPPKDEAGVTKALRGSLGGLGFDVQRTADVLAGYARVQNTYLATFQTLGGLGLLLGTFGIVTVLLRSVVERRSELAMLLALGLRRRQVVAMIVIEHGWLLLLGLAIGSSAALVAVVPHVVSALADVNWLSLGGMLAACLLAGLLSCAIAAIASVRCELLPALRSE